MSRSVIESTVGVNGTAEMDSRLVQGHGPVFSQVAWQPRCENSSKRGVLTWGGAHRLQKPQEPHCFERAAGTLRASCGNRFTGGVSRLDSTATLGLTG